MDVKNTSNDKLQKDLGRFEHRIKELEATQISLGKDLLLSRSANQFLSSVLDTIDALVAVVDSKGHIVRLNKAFQQTLGESCSLDNSKPLWDLFLLPDDIASVRATVDDLLAGHSRTATGNYLAREKWTPAFNHLVVHSDSQ